MKNLFSANALKKSLILAACIVFLMGSVTLVLEHDEKGRIRDFTIKVQGRKVIGHLTHTEAFLVGMTLKGANLPSVGELVNLIVNRQELKPFWYPTASYPSVLLDTDAQETMLFTQKGAGVIKGISFGLTAAVHSQQSRFILYVDGTPFINLQPEDLNTGGIVNLSQPISLQKYNVDGINIIFLYMDIPFKNGFYITAQRIAGAGNHTASAAILVEATP